jgi:hypothetical protein
VDDAAFNCLELREKMTSHPNAGTEAAGLYKHENQQHNTQLLWVESKILLNICELYN